MSWGDTYYVRLRLSRWGRWGALEGPTMAPSIFGRLMVTGHFSAALGGIPEEIAQLEEIIHRAEVELKMALIDYYQRRCGFTQGGRERGMSAHCFKQLVRRAEGYVRQELF